MMIDRVGQRAGRRRRPALSARSVLLGVLALAFLFLDLAAIAASLGRGAEAALAITARRAPCVVDAHRGEAPPAHDQDHSQCCVLCGARDLDGAALASAMQTSEALMSRGALLVAPPSRRHDAWVRPPVGWASSWSSQAPPHFS